MTHAQLNFPGRGRSSRNMRRVARVASVLALLLGGIGPLAGCGRSNVRPEPGESTAALPGAGEQVPGHVARPAGERPCPTIHIAPGRPAIVDFYDLVGGRVANIRFAAPRRIGAARGETGPAPLLTWLPEPDGIPPHRLHIDAPTESLADGLWFVETTLDAESEGARNIPLTLAIAVYPPAALEIPRGLSAKRGATPCTPRPVPSALVPAALALGPEDAAFYIDSLQHSAAPTPPAFALLVGNDRFELTNESAPDGSASAAPGGLRYRLDREAGLVVVRGLRDVANRSRTELPLRLFCVAPGASNPESAWGECSLFFGSEGRRLFEPRDAVLYHAVIDRLENGSKSNDAIGGGQAAGWQGGDLDGAGKLLGSDGVKRFGVNTLVFSPPGRPASDPPGAKTLLAPRGLRPSAPSSLNPRFGDFDDFQELIADAHGAGINVVWGFAPYVFDDRAAVVREKPQWFTALGPAPAPGAPSRGDAAASVWAAPGLVRPVFPEGDPAAAERIGGFGLWWVSILESDGLHALGSDLLPDAFWRRLSRRIREEAALPRQQGTMLLADASARARTDAPNPAGRRDGSARLEGAAGGPPAIVDPPPAAEAPTPADGATSATLYPSPFDARWDWQVTEALRTACCAPAGDLRVVASLLARRSTPAGPEAFVVPVVASGSPDIPAWRTLVRGRGVRPHGALLATALYTWPGAPLLHAGDEAGGGDVRRLPETGMPPVANPDGGATNPGVVPGEDDAAGPSVSPIGAMSFGEAAAGLAAMRAQSPALRRGAPLVLSATESTLAFGRVAWREGLVVVMNRAATAQAVQVPLTGALAGAKELHLRWSTVPATAGAAARPQQVLPAGGEAPVRVELPAVSAAIYEVR